MNAGKKIAIGIGVVLIACIIFTIVVFALQTQSNDKFTFNTAAVLEGELKNEGKQTIFSCVLGEEFDDGKSVMFKSSHAVVEIFIDGELFETLGDEKPVVGKSPGICWHIVDLPEDCAGSELVICRTSVYATYKGTDPNFYYGSRGDCVLRLVGNCLYVLIMDAISIVLGVICLLLHLRTLRSKDNEAVGGFLWIGLFAIIIALWSLRQAGFLRFLIPYSQVLYFVDVFTIFLAAVPLNMFVYTISKSKWGQSIVWFVPVYLFEVVFGILMQVAGVFDIAQMLIALHILIGVNAVYMFWAIHREAWKNKGSAASRFRIPLYTVVAFAIMEMIHYYFPRNTSIFLPTGVMVFILMLVWQQVSAYFHAMEEQKLVYYEKFANTDMLTGALNRNAYETKLKQLVPEKADLNGCGAALFDLNDLKLINDNFGHEEGDDAIKRCHNLIVTAFGDSDNCYRIGGDEFVLLGVDGAEIEQKLKEFDRLVGCEREGLEYPFNVACGYAVFDAEHDKNMQDTVKRSDTMMYLDKKEKKQLQDNNA